MEKFNPKDFKKFFSMEVRGRGLQASFLLGSSVAKADIFLTNKGNKFDIFFKKSKEQICGKKGIKIYGNASKFKKYIKDLKKSVDYGNKVIVPRYGKKIKFITKKEFHEILNHLQRFWFLYGIVEFPYMDLAYQESIKTENKLMKNNLNMASKYKFKARELLNKFFFRQGVIENLTVYISDNLIELKNSGDYLFAEELLRTFDGWKPSKKMIEERKKCYSAANINGKLIVFSYKKSLELNKKFTSFKEDFIIKGVSASPGIARGKAIISPLLDNHLAIKKIDKKMKKGDILIAETTSPDTLMLCNKAAAIIAEQSGLLSHAAVVSREKKIPCIIQATNATKIIKDGDLVEVDANRGIVKIIK